MTDSEYKPEIVDWIELDRSTNDDDNWVASLVLSAITDAKLFDDKEWVAKKNGSKLEIILTISGKQAPIMPFVKKLRDEFNERVEKAAAEMMYERTYDLRDMIDSVEKEMLKRFPNAKNKEDY